MRKLVSDTSIDAYYSGKVKSDAVKKVIDYARHHKTFTRRMIEQETGLRASTITGIVTPRIYDRITNPDGVFIESLGKFPCRITGNDVHWLEHRGNNGGQSSL